MGQVIPIDRSRVDLHRDLVTAREVNQRIQSFAKLAELLTVEMGGSTPPEVNLAYVQSTIKIAAEIAQVVDLFQKMVEKELNFSPVVGDQNRTQTVVAQFLTEWNMDIQMEGFTSFKKFDE